MTDPRLQRVVAEWRSNRRLRLGALAILMILGTHVTLVLSDARRAREAQYARDAELLGRLEEASRESAWPARAKSAGQALDALRRSMPASSSDGLAQAEMQAWLTDLAAYAGVASPAVRVETSLAVPGQPGMWQVLARLDGAASPAALPVLARALALAKPWVRTEHLELATGDAPRVALVVRGFYRAADARDAKAPPPRPGGIPTAPPGTVPPPMAVNPLAPPGTAPAVPASGAAAAGLPPAGAARPAQGRTPAQAGSEVPSSQRYPGMTSEQRKALNPRRKKKDGQ